MRDIRGDPQDRAKWLEQQMNAAQLQFGQLLEEPKKGTGESALVKS
jgi:hypothetical protein